MATSVKMREADKRRLDRLQGALTLRSGRKVTQEDLMAWLLNIGERDPDLLLGDASRPMTKKEVAAMEKLIVDTGVRSREEDIDKDIVEGSH